MTTVYTIRRREAYSCSCFNRKAAWRRKFARGECTSGVMYDMIRLIEIDHETWHKPDARLGGKIEDGTFTVDMIRGPFT